MKLTSVAVAALLSLTYPSAVPAQAPDLGVTVREVMELILTVNGIDTECEITSGAGEGYPWEAWCETPLTLVQMTGAHFGDVDGDDPVAKVSVVLMVTDTSASAASELAGIMIGLVNTVMQDWDGFAPTFNGWLSRKENAEVFVYGNRVGFTDLSRVTGSVVVEIEATIIPNSN